MSLSAATSCQQLQKAFSAAGDVEFQETDAELEELISLPFLSIFAGKNNWEQMHQKWPEANLHLICADLRQRLRMVLNTVNLLLGLLCLSVKNSTSWRWQLDQRLFSQPLYQDVQIIRSTLTSTTRKGQTSLLKENQPHYSSSQTSGMQQRRYQTLGWMWSAWQWDFFINSQGYTESR